MSFVPDFQGLIDLANDEEGSDDEEESTGYRYSHIQDNFAVFKQDTLAEPINVPNMTLPVLESQQDGEGIIN